MMEWLNTPMSTILTSWVGIVPTVLVTCIITAMAPN